MRLLISLWAALVLSGCTGSPEIEPAYYVSPLRYQQLTCGEIAVRRLTVSEEIREVSSRRPSDADKTAAYLAATGRSEGILANLGDGAQAVQNLEAKTNATLAQLRGELLSLKAVSEGKGCPV